jgi:hypothetical protein
MVTSGIFLVEKSFLVVVSTGRGEETSIGIRGS